MPECGCQLDGVWEELNVGLNDVYSERSLMWVSMIWKVGGVIMWVRIGVESGRHLMWVNGSVESRRSLMWVSMG